MKILRSLSQRTAMSGNQRGQASGSCPGIHRFFRLWHTRNEREVTEAKLLLPLHSAPHPTALPPSGWGAASTGNQPRLARQQSRVNSTHALKGARLKSYRGPGAGPWAHLPCQPGEAGTHPGVDQAAAGFSYPILCHLPHLHLLFLWFSLQLHSIKKAIILHIE